MYSATVLIQRLNVGVGITKDRRTPEGDPEDESEKE